MKLAASPKGPGTRHHYPTTIATRRCKKYQQLEAEETTTFSCYRNLESSSILIGRSTNVKQQQQQNHETQANQMMPTRSSEHTQQDRKTAAKRKLSTNDLMASRKGLTETRRNKKCQCKMPATAAATTIILTTTLLATVCLLSLAANGHQTLAVSNASSVVQQMAQQARAEQNDFRRLTKRSEHSETPDDGGHPHYEPLTLDGSDGGQHSSDPQSAGSQPEPEGGNALASGAGSSNRALARGKKTLYACEEKQLQIECQQGESIQLVRANYGRFSIQICNEHGQLDWKVNCMSPASFQIISSSCQAKQSCQLLASNSIFGDACPGTQKYLEVHYQCVSGGAINNRTTTLGNGGELLLANQPGRHSSVGSAANQGGQQSRQQQQLASNKQNVIQQQPQQPQQDTSTITSEMASRPSYAPTMQTMFGWPVASQSPPTSSLSSSQGRQQATSGGQLSLPPWIREVPLATAAGGPAAFMESSSSFGNRDSNFNSNSQETQQQTTTTAATSTIVAHSPAATRAHCPETVWRQIRWPATEAGQLVQMPCPAHAHSGNPADAYPASFACLPNANWALRVQAARCQSIWLRNLTQRLEAGDSPLSIVNELALRTRPPSTPLMAMVGAPAAGGNSQSSWSGVAQNYGSQQPGLFGDDIVQIGRIVRRLVVELDELLNRIADDKQRLAFAREMVQSIVELVNNLAHEQQLDAWLDLAPNLGERQRVAVSLVQSLERASVLLASSSSAQSGHAPSGSQQQLLDEESASSSPAGATPAGASFVKVTENAYVAIKTLPLPLAAAGASRPASGSQQQPALLEVSFPSETSTLGTKWQGAEQRFTLHLQASGGGSADQDSLKYRSSNSDGQQPANSATATATTAAAEAGQTLKIVFVMIRGLGAQMEPKTPSSMSASSNDQELQQQPRRLVVNSDLVSLSIVADPRHKYAPVKVDFSAPIELVFRHLDSSARQSNAADWLQQHQASKQQQQRGSQPVCVYWDANISDWLSKGCKLIGTNRTHSTCACKDLAPFALLSEWDEQQFGGQSAQAAAFDGAGQSQLHRQQEQQQQQPKVQLDSVENELILPTKMLYLAKMLDGRLFEADQQQPAAITANPTSAPAASGANLRLLIYVSCLVSAALLALHLAAAAYNQAHARRLLGAIPTQPPPPLLVSNSLVSASMRNNSSMPSGLHHLQQQHHLVNSNSTDLASYGSDYSATLNANKIKLQAEAAATGVVGFESPTMQAVFSASPASSGGKVAPSIDASSGILRQLKVPIHLTVQLLALELLIVLLVESQNQLQRASATRHAPFVSYYSNAYYSQQASASNLLGLSMLDPIGTVTWVLVLGLYYLIAAITCWLFGQLIELNHSLWLSYRCARSRANSSSAGSAKQLIGGIGQLAVNGSASSTGSSSGSDKSVQYGMATTSTAMSSVANPVNSAGSIYGRQLVAGAQAASTNLYNNSNNNNNNGTSCYGQQQQQNGGLIHSSTSPTSSFSSTGGQSSTIMAPSSHHLHHHSATLGKAQAPPAPIAASCAWLAQVLDPSSGKPLNLLAVHTLPVLWVALIAWLSASQSQTVNSFAFTTSLSSQLASWPLLVDASSSPLATLLYYGPAVCLILFGLAVLALRRGQRLSSSSSQGAASGGGSLGAGGMQATRASQPPASAASVVNPYGSSSFVGNSLGLSSQHHSMAGNFLVSSSSGANGDQRGRELPQLQQQQQMALNKQSMCQENPRPTTTTAAYYWQAVDQKKAKFVCTMLLALLALHSICWISFFAYLHGALNWPSSAASHCCYLIYLFSSANLLLALLIIWCQRRTLRRAAQLAGLTRLLSCVCTCFTGHASAASRRRARFYQAHQQQGSHAAIGKSASGGIKVSPSSQSLFLVSQAAQQQRQQQQQQQQQYQSSGQASYHYGPSFHSASSSQALQAQQHLYQSLANQQHIYDSTTAINEQQQQLNVMQLMQQRQQQHHLQQQQQQHNSFTLNRPMQLPSMQQQQQLQRQPMTLKPMVGAGMMPFGGQSALDSNGQLLVLDANGGLKQQQQSFLCHNNGAEQARARQQQQQQSGEADGPLVAFSSSLSPATFGPNISAHHAPAAANRNHQSSRQQQKQQQQLAEQKQHQLFSQQQQDQQSSQSPSPVNCNSAATTSSYSGASGATDANQHQYCSIASAPASSNNNASGNGSGARQAPANYADALKAMMLQQQNESTPVSQHFRRANSRPEHQQRHQPAMIDRQAAAGSVDCASNGNIYDVANYALGQ